jgi:two-component system sensor histidine kinase KdpD
MKAVMPRSAFPFVFALIIVIVVAGTCFYFTSYLGYRTVALILLVTVSIIAMLFEIFPVLIAAVFSALIWNYFFIPPLYTFHIGQAEDTLMFTMYFLIALVNGVLTMKIRQGEKKLLEKEEKEKTIGLYNTILNALSHELRTPIATIIGSLDHLRTLTVSTDEKLQIELQDQIESASLRLNRQVENLLNMSRLESGILKPKNDWCDLNEFLYHELQKFDLHQRKRIVVSYSDRLPFVFLDRGLLEQIMHNLVHNALTHTPEEKEVMVGFYFEKQKLRLEVEDGGNGLDGENKELIFDKFYRGKNVKPGGVGLGLSIVKGCIQAMGGEIAVKQGIRGGSLFQVSFDVKSSYIKNEKNE